MPWELGKFLDKKVLMLSPELEVLMFKSPQTLYHTIKLNLQSHYVKSLKVKNPNLQCLNKANKTASS